MYRWDRDQFSDFERLPSFGDTFKSQTGMATQDNVRYLRLQHEIERRNVARDEWAPFIKGGAGREWIEPLTSVVAWHYHGLEMKVHHEFAYSSLSKYIMSESRYFELGVAFCTTGTVFSARLHRFPSIFSNVASSVFARDRRAEVVCALNTTRSRLLLADLNPTIHFELGDVERLPLLEVRDSEVIVARLDSAFGTHEAHREPSFEFEHPGGSPWSQAQKWAQSAVDRPLGAPLDLYTELLELEPATDHVSFALGVVLGRFKPGGGEVGPHESGSDCSDVAVADVDFHVDVRGPGGLFLDGASEVDDLDSPESGPLVTAWRVHGPAIDGTSDVRGLRAWLRSEFFNIHKKMYENRPIHWPLSSANRTFVAWVNIHRMGPHTLTAVLARAQAAVLRLKGRDTDLRRDRDSADATASKAAEKQVGLVRKQLAEAEQFVSDLRMLATKGPPQPSPSVPAREVDASYDPDLDDGVMINTSALWPILEPQWKDPKKWWIELATAKGRKDYDWSHLAARYWPTRVDAKCKDDPSLGVAHGCFWRYHPARAYAWELRLQDEISTSFLIEEADAEHCRAAFLRDHRELAADIKDKEERRQERRRARADDDDSALQPSAAALPLVPSLPSGVEGGAWTRPGTDVTAETHAALAAVLKGLAGPVPPRHVRLAVTLALEPALLAPFLPETLARRWLRVAGVPAQAPQPANVVVLAERRRRDNAWGAAVRQLYGTGRLLADPRAGTWAAGRGLDTYFTRGWPEGRAAFVLGALAALDLGRIEAQTPDILPEVALVAA
jgi:hypothetical protein